MSSGDTCVLPGNDTICICPAEAGGDTAHNLIQTALQTNYLDPITTEITSTLTSGDSYGPSGKHRTSICPAEADEDAARILIHRNLQSHQSNHCPTSSGNCANTDHCDCNASRNLESAESSSPPLKIYYQNTRGLRTKMEDFFLAVSEMEYDVVVLTETWLNDQHLSTQLFGNSYTVHRDDRDPVVTGMSRGGGVLIAVANHLPSSRVDVHTAIDLDQVWVKIDLREVRIFIGVVYFSPDQAAIPSKIEDHLNSVRAVSDIVSTSDINLLFGDYNQPNIVWSNAPSGFAYPDPVESRFSVASSTLLDGMSLLDLKQLNVIKNTIGRTLDLAFIGGDKYASCKILPVSDPLVTADSFHPPILSLLDCSPPVRFVEPDESGQFNFRKADFNALNSALQNTDWSVLETSDDVDDAVAMFNSTLTSMFREYVPVFRRRLRPPWSNNHLKNLKRKRAAALRRYSINRNMYTKRIFVLASNKYKSLNRKLYHRHVRQKQSNLKRNPRQFWSFVNDKRKQSGLPCSMFLGTQAANTQQESCDLFAEHFADAFQLVPSDDELIRVALRNVPTNVISLNFTYFTEEDVLNAIKKLKPSTSAGPDGIPPIVLKQCASSLCQPLLMICNKSVELGRFPESWKLSVMFPAFKKGDKRNVQNYRGVTSLCAGSKLLETLVGRVLFAGVRNYITTNQHGFFPGRSINTNLVEFTSFAIHEMEAGGQLDTIYTDLKSAFDRVNHDLLLAKIERLGATERFVSWLRSYLYNRVLYVKVGNATSVCYQATSGVPQGSNLGPLLFSIFFNDICLVLPDGTRLLYADDLKIFLRIRSIQDCKELQRLIDVFQGWCSRNLLLVSISKCSVISFTRRKTPIVWSYTMCGEPLERTSVVKDLGVLLDAKLSFTDHYSSIISKANRNLGLIFRISSEFRDPYCLRALYVALVRSVLESASIVWCPYTDNWGRRIEAVQRRFIRYALRFLPWNNPENLPPYEDRCRLLGLETLSNRRSISKAAFVGKLLLNAIDSPTLLRQISFNVPPRLLRNRDFLRLDYHRTDYGQNEPVRAMCSVFNSVVSVFDFNVSVDVFITRLKIMFNRL